MKYKVTGYVTLEVSTLVEADSEEEAEKIAQDRDTDICIHGSEFAVGLDESEFTLVDGMPENLVDINAVEEY